MLFRNLSLNQKGFLQATGVASYCALAGTVIRYGSSIFGEMAGLLAPTVFLILFSLSVLVCGLLVFFQPYQMFFEGKKRTAAELVLHTTGWLAFYLAAFIILLVFLR